MTSQNISEVVSEAATSSHPPATDIPSEATAEAAAVEVEALPSEEDRLVAGLRAELAAQVEAAQEAKNQFLRTLADFDNYKKRTQKEQAEQIKLANERLMKEWLPVIDNLERAMASVGETRDFDKMLEGVGLIHKQQMAVLSRFGVRPIESLNQPFDPLCHQSIGQGEVDTPEKENRVIAEAQRGYLLYERVLRPALVVIGRLKKSENPAASEDKAEGVG